MAITTLDGLIGAAKQRFSFIKTTSGTITAGDTRCYFDFAGTPGAGVLAGANTANGVVPTDATTGFSPIAAFGGAAKGYLTNVQFASSVTGMAYLFDLLWKGGAYAFNASQTLSAQPSFSSRLPLVGGSPDYSAVELWVEGVTSGTGVQNVNIGYTNQDNTSGRSTGTIAVATMANRRLHPIALQAGDSGLRTVDTVTGSVATAGTFNVLVMRRLWSAPVVLANTGVICGPDLTGMPEVFADSALYFAMTVTGTGYGTPQLYYEIANG